MKIWITRHGQTKYNKMKLMQGRTDEPLNETGIAQAKAARERIGDVHFDAVYASPLDRAIVTGAIIGGESSGGLAVRGHIAGKDGIYAAALLVEMLAVTEKSVSQLYREITEKYGKLYYEDTSFTMRPERKEELKDVLFVQKQLPDFGAEIDHVSREDGCKVYFTGGSWVICRFSGTEPLLRMAAEGSTEAQAKSYIQTWRKALGL